MNMLVVQGTRRETTEDVRDRICIYVATFGHLWPNEAKCSRGRYSHTQIHQQELRGNTVEAASCISTSSFGFTMFSFMTSVLKKSKAKGATPAQNQDTSSLGQSTSTANEALGSKSVKDTPVKVGWLRSHRRHFYYGFFYELLVLYSFLNVNRRIREKGNRGQSENEFQSQ